MAERIRVMLNLKACVIHLHIDNASVRFIKQCTKLHAPWSALPQQLEQIAQRPSGIHDILRAII